MNVAEFESWLNAVENPCGDYSQADAKALLIYVFRESQDNYQTLLDDAVEMRKRLAESERQNGEPWMKYPHMCRDGHDEIGHSDSESERCPVCRLQDRVQTLEDALLKVRNHNISMLDVWDIIDQALAAKEPTA